MADVMDAVGAILDGHEGLTLGTNLFLGLLPDDEAPDECAAVFLYGGADPDETFRQSIERPRVQVQCRGAAAEFAATRDRLAALRGLLGAVVNTDAGGVYFLRIRPTATIVNLGPDSRGRERFAASFEVSHL